ncbi:hypothetical protein ACNOIU_16055 (plasmid) [Exiguobacterium mexicanum]|uniref:Novel toxin 21 domain-containing protein n=1 Tax=Exiguobacterium mexicanum TaxID=340146 RepID=A0ABT7MTD6_9BACL|nr:hypothetical protein [Exiguobacterium mexicanum]MDL5378435.1 hypothetical protein [Exiguobacterium mexicanum]
MKKRKSGISAFLVTVLCFSAITPISANTGVENDLSPATSSEEYTDWNFEYKSIEEVPKELLEPGFYSEEEIFHIPSEYLDPYHPDTIYTTYDPYSNDSESGQVQTFALGAAAGVYFIPGIGQVAITVTGAVVIGGATIAAGSWLYNKVTAYFGKKDAEQAASEIPKSLKKTNMQVDLSKFKDKNGRTPANKSSGTFKNGKWVITKDNSGHLGYNGNKKVWKIGNPGRTGSLDSNGYIIDK